MTTVLTKPTAHRPVPIRYPARPVQSGSQSRPAAFTPASNLRPGPTPARISPSTTLTTGQAGNSDCTDLATTIRTTPCKHHDLLFYWPPLPRPPRTTALPAPMTTATATATLPRPRTKTKPSIPTKRKRGELSLRQVPKYQILPPPTPEYLADLRATIIERGVDEPIIVDEDGQIVDGWQRYTICQELGIFCPRQVRKFATEAEKFELALMRNCSRRQLNRTQKKALISTYLQVDSRISDNWLATIIGGISKNNVAQVRVDLIATGSIKQHKTLRGRDGLYRPNRYAKIIANSYAELIAAQEAIENLPSSCDGRFMDAFTVTRRSRRSITGQRAFRPAKPVRSSTHRLFHCRFQELEQDAPIRQARCNSC